jgi:NADPH-dependent curcumin reductase CurA
VTTSRQLRLAARPDGEVKDSDFDLVEVPVPEPGDGELVVEVTHVSIDPAMRGWMRDAPSYVPPVKLGEVMRALAVGRVVASGHPGFATGDLVQGTFGVTEHALSDGTGVHKLPVGDGAPLAAYLGVLGMTGLTAYFGLIEVGRVQAGDTVLVSGAAGAVGSTVGQIAKIKGARAIGIAGGPDKCRLLTEQLGFDAALDYKTSDLPEQLRARTPDRVNVYFDNVGGEILDLALTRIGRGARVVICGAISQYNRAASTGPSNYMALLVQRASMTGFLVFDYADRYPEALAELSGWLADGRLKNLENTVRGDISEFPQTLNKLFHGENTGKLVLELTHGL